jgi:hypothetical protein
VGKFVVRELRVPLGIPGRLAGFGSDRTFNASTIP